MKTSILPSVIIATLFLSACNSDNKKKEIEIPVSVFADFQGTWEQKGTGNLWQFSNDTLSLYNFNSFGCVATGELALSEIEQAIDYLSLNSEKNKFQFIDPGSNNQNFDSISQLPDSCAAANLLSEDDLDTNFEFFWHTMNDYYAFFAQRDINWQTIYEEYKPQISSLNSEAEFIELIEGIIEDFNDGHLSLFSEVGDASGESISGFLLEVFRSNLVDAEENFGQAYQALKSYNDETLKAHLKNNELMQHADGNAIQWGHLSDTLGYIRIERLQHLSFPQEQEPSGNIIVDLASAKQDVADTNTIMQAALAELGNKDALIIDLRFNPGGYDNISLKIASYFSTEQKVIGTKHINNRNFISNSDELTVEPSPITPFTKPVYVITGSSTGSAAEILAMSLKALPNVTMIGEPTAGALSDQLEHQLPNGSTLSLSHEIYKDENNVIQEHIGVLPDIEMPVYASQDIVYASNTPIDYVMQTLGAQSQVSPSAEDVEQAFINHFNQTNIPGIAVAIIKDDKIVYQKASGFSDIVNEVPVTMDTPFNVGSISKAVLAAGIMQQVESGLISLDDKLTNMNLAFNPNNPLNDNNEITLRHLVTHTSGIRDSAGYNCSYYLHENNISLYRLFGVEECPENVSTDPATFFAVDYFAENGRYVMDGIYNSGDAGLPNEEHDYSNVGAGLAAFAIEQKLNINFAQHMQQNLFEPLGLHNTAWHHEQLNTSNPKAIQYALDSELQPNAVPEFSYPTFYDGDLNISANDLAKFLITITNGGEYQGVRVLKETSVNTMLSNQTDVLNQRDKQGVFWYWNGAFFGHTGGDPGTNAVMHYNAVTKTGIVVLMNGEDDHLGEGNVDSMLMPLFATLYRYGLSQ